LLAIDSILNTYFSKSTFLRHFFSPKTAKFTFSTSMDKKLWEIYLYFQAQNYHLEQATVYDKRKNKTGLKGRIFAFVQIRTTNRKSSELKNRTIYAQNYKQQQPTTV